MNISIMNMWNEGTRELGKIATQSKTGVLILLGCFFILLTIKIIVDLGR